MKLKSPAMLSLLFTGVTIVFFYSVTRTALDPAYKWIVFGGHLVMAFAALGMGIWALLRREWLGLVSIAICGYFLWTQLIG